MTKKYALVRVDDNCPDVFEYTGDIVLACTVEYCSQCIDKDEGVVYGDTKEQLEEKISTVLTREFTKNKESNEVNIDDVARAVVKYLGIEE